MILTREKLDRALTEGRIENQIVSVNNFATAIDNTQRKKKFSLLVPKNYSGIVSHYKKKQNRDN